MTFDPFAWFRREMPMPPKWTGVDTAMLAAQRAVVADEPLSELPALIRTAHTMCNRTRNLTARAQWTAKLWAATERLDRELEHTQRGLERVTECCPDQ